MSTIEVNGIKYEQIPQRRPSKGAMKLMSVAAMFGGLSMYGENSYNRKKPNVDIISEFKLIQEKKSKLSKSDRDWVEMMFFKNFKEVK